MHQVGDEVPEIESDSTVGRFGYHDMVDGVWAVLVTATAFDPVSTTELGQLAKLSDEFAARDTRVTAVVSGSSKALIRKWIKRLEDIENVSINFPVFIDADSTIRTKILGLPEKQNLLVITDIDKRIRLTMHYPQSVGRNFYEVLRAIDSLHLAFFHQVATPANWAHGQDVLVPPHISTLAARSIFPSGMVQVRDWFRTTPQPDL